MVKNETKGAFPPITLYPEIAKIYTHGTRRTESLPFTNSF